MTTKTKHGTRWLCTTALLMAMNIIMSMSAFPFRADISI